MKNIPKKCIKAVKVLIKEGPTVFMKKVANQLKPQMDYMEWRKEELPSKEELLRQRKEQFEEKITFSILVPLYNTPILFLKEMIQSVLDQSYLDWELCLADGSDDGHREVGEWCERLAKEESRVKYQKLKENKGISENTNVCIEMASGDYLALFDHDDLLAPDALYEVQKAIREKQAEVIYTDEDKVNTDTTVYSEPHFKSDFNLDLLRSNNYICHFFVVKKEIVDQVGGLCSEYNGSQDYDFIFRCVEQTKRIVHIPKVLYHWRMHESSTAANQQSKLYCYTAGERAIASHLKRCGVKGEVTMQEHLGFYRVTYPVQGEPRISILIPNKDEKDTLKTCIDSIFEKSSYRNFEIIIIENNSVKTETFAYYQELESYCKRKTNGNVQELELSDEGKKQMEEDGTTYFENGQIRVVEWKGEFNFSKINNYGASFAKGEYLLFLNNDMEVISEDWMERMVANCQREEVGITGAKLYYPDKTIQHAGVIIGLGGIAGHAFSRQLGIDPGYFARAVCQQNFSAVTAACMMVSKADFIRVGGFDETLAVAFNDIDLCLKVRHLCGKLVVFDPAVALTHYESKSRGAEDTPQKQKRFHQEIVRFAEKWEEDLKGDSYYNPNLTLIAGDFSLKKPEERFRKELEYVQMIREIWKKENSQA